MNRKLARKIAEIITNEQLQIMFNNAKSQITDWAQPSACNKGLTKGTAWNVLAHNFDSTINYNILAKTNMVREFGNFLPADIKFQEKKPISAVKLPFHQNPIF